MMWILVALWAHPAQASVPDGVRPVLAAPRAPDRYRAFRARHDLAPADLHCQEAWHDGLLLCFRVWDGGQRRWVHEEDLERWSVSPAALRQVVAARSRAHVAQAAWVDVDGMSDRYLQLVDGDGWAAAGVLHPDALAARLGGLPIRVAVPSQGVLVAYRPTGDDLDKVMAVGVRELYASQPSSVSSVVYQWDGSRWTTFGQAVPRSPAP